MHKPGAGSQGIWSCNGGFYLQRRGCSRPRGADNITETARLCYAACAQAYLHQFVPASIQVVTPMRPGDPRGGSFDG